MEKTQEGKIQEITDELEKGIKGLFESQKYSDYLKVMSKFYQYSFNNSILISMQKPDATMVAGYTSWKSNFHRNVVKGERGIHILAPSPYKIKKDIAKVDPDTNQPIIGSDGQPLKERIQVSIPAYKITTVFDVSQTEGKPLPEIATALSGDVKDFDKFYSAIRQTSPVPMEVKNIDGSANGYYNLNDKTIVIKEGMSQSQTLKTAIHELSHAKLHDTDTGIEKDNLPDRGTKEVEAESIAYTVCSHYGLDTSDYSFGYIAGWSSDKEMEELKKSMNTIRSTAADIINGIDKELIIADREERIDKLAKDIDELSKEYDPYEYMNDVKDSDKHVDELKNEIRLGNVDCLQKLLQPFKDDQESVEQSLQAKDISERLKEYSKVKSEEPVLANATSKHEEQEKEHVEKQRHRR